MDAEDYKQDITSIVGGVLSFFTLIVKIKPLLDSLRKKNEKNNQVDKEK